MIAAELLCGVRFRPTVIIDPAWQYVIVTGISSCYKENDDLHRLILVRQQTDILPVVP